MLIEVEALERSDGRVVLFYGDRLIGMLDPGAVQVVPATNGNGARKSSRTPGKQRVAAAAGPKRGAKGKNTGILRRCQECSAKTKRTICPNGHQVATA